MTTNPHLVLSRISRAEMWADVTRIYADAVPYRTAKAIWGFEVVDARSVEDCPECGYAGDIFLLCGYYESRQCECGAVLGTTMQCECDPES